MAAAAAAAAPGKTTQRHEDGRRGNLLRHEEGEEDCFTSVSGKRESRLRGEFEIRINASSESGWETTKSQANRQMGLV